MDNASDYGSEDSRFDSWLTRVFSVISHFGMNKVNLSFWPWPGLYLRGATFSYIQQVEGGRTTGGTENSHMCIYALRKSLDLYDTTITMCLWISVYINV